MTEVEEKPLKLQKAKKAAPKKAKGEPAVEITADFLATLPLLSALELPLLQRLVERVSYVELARGDVLHEGAPAADDAESPVFLLLFGDLHVSRRRAGGPVEVINFLRPGEVYIQKLFCEEQTEQVELRALCPIKALKLAYNDVNYLLKKNPGFREVFSDSVRVVTERQQGYFDDEFRREISQFLVKERLTFAGRVKIKRMDICIECDGCYDACKERHGTDRLGTSEVKYGLTEIPQNCHNCEVPECVDKCKFGHISIDEHTREILISDNCVGCTMCSRGCSFGAIRMHSLEDLDVQKYFPDRSPDAKGKNIAQKCDNCTGYPDQACITACPTGALFQIEGSKLFEYWQQFSVHYQPGHGGVASPERFPRGWRRFWLLITLLSFGGLFWECVGRLFWPELTFTTLMFEQGWLKEGLDPLTPFRPGDFLSHTLGYVGGALCLATQVYLIGKWLAPRWGTLQVWMEAHIFLGFLGGIFGFFHTAFYFYGWVSMAAFVSMVAAILTGAVGRYILFLVPRSQAGQVLALEEARGQIAALEQEVEQLFASPVSGHTMMLRLDELEKDRGADAEEQKLLKGLFQVAGEERAQRRQIEELAGELERLGVLEGKAREVLELLKQRARLERSVRRHGVLARILKRYRVVHVLVSNIMFGALLLHIVISLLYRVGN